METPIKNQSSVQQLLKSIDKIILMQAQNLSELASGKTPEILIDSKVWENTLKMIEKLSSLEQFEKTVAAISLVDIDGEEGDAIIKKISEGNMFEERSKLIKAKLNGSANK